MPHPHPNRYYSVIRTRAPGEGLGLNPIPDICTGHRSSSVTDFSCPPPLLFFLENATGPLRAYSSEHFGAA
jgi:hypothetical protein